MIDRGRRRSRLVGQKYIVAEHGSENQDSQRAAQRYRQRAQFIARAATNAAGPTKNQDTHRWHFKEFRSGTAVTVDVIVERLERILVHAVLL